ncbi:MAG: hypothetical protein ABIP55_08585 [Tepidisphaeraceae bacterium]
MKSSPPGGNHQRRSIFSPRNARNAAFTGRADPSRAGAVLIGRIDRNGTSGEVINGVVLDEYVAKFFVLPGDANHNRTIDIDDYGQIDFNAGSDDTRMSGALASVATSPS